MCEKVTPMRNQSSLVNKAIKSQISLKAVSNKDFAEVVGLSLSALYTRLHGERDWKIDEIAKAAEFFGVPMISFFESSPSQKASV